MPSYGFRDRMKKRLALMRAPVGKEGEDALGPEEGGPGQREPGDKKSCSRSTIRDFRGFAETAFEERAEVVEDSGRDDVDPPPEADEPEAAAERPAEAKDKPPRK